MIWGEVINEIRRFHLALLDHSPNLHRPHSPEFTLDPAQVPFPESTDGMDDWDAEQVDAKIAEWVEFHPVERALLEGPLLPIHEIKFKNEAEFVALASAIVELEKSWMSRSTRPGEAPAQWEPELRSRLLRLQTRAGIRRLREA